MVCVCSNSYSINGGINNFKSDRVVECLDQAIQNVSNKIFEFNELVCSVCSVVFTHLKSLTFEALKVAAVAGALFIFVTLVFPSSEMALYAIVVAPVLEEIAFRGLLQSTIEGIQYGVNYLCSSQLTEEDQKTQKIFRVRLTSFLFGLAHIFNHTAVLLMVVHTCTAGFGSLAYGYLKEDTQSLTMPIIGHAMNNTIALASESPYLPAGAENFLLLAWVVNEISWYCLATQGL